MLVVDDDEDAIDVLTTVMNACGVEVLFVRSASEGLAYLDTTPYLDVVVTDISMPSIDGYEFPRKIRKHSAPANVEVAVDRITKIRPASTTSKELCIEFSAKEALHALQYRGQLCIVDARGRVNAIRDDDGSIVRRTLP
jgi:two-component system, chemotaxis family, CheB/CheR fusion protein